jgi:hypothetical protein
MRRTYHLYPMLCAQEDLTADLHKSPSGQPVKVYEILARDPERAFARSR